MSYQYLDGVERELAKLRDFPAKIEANVIRGAVRAAAMVELRAAKPMIPLGPGRAGMHLADTLRVSTRVSKGRASATVKLGNLRKGVRHAHFLLGGTKPHLIKGKVNGVLSFGGIVRSVVQHPGTKANPVLNKADALSRVSALRAAFDYADQRTKKIIAEQGN